MWAFALSLSVIPVPAISSAPCPPATVQFLDDDHLLLGLMSLIQKANQEVWIGTFHFKAGGHPDSAPDQLLDELIKAHRRGVMVQVLLEKPEDPSSEIAQDNERTASLLRNAGIAIHWDRADRRSHMKVAVVDGRFAIIGSHNLTNSGLRHNHELSILVDSPCLALRTVDYLKDIVREAGGNPGR